MDETNPEDIPDTRMIFVYVSKLEKFVKQQGDEIVLLKSALAEALRRIRVLEEKTLVLLATPRSKRVITTPRLNAGSASGDNTSGTSTRPRQSSSQSLSKKPLSAKRKTSLSGLAIKEEPEERDSAFEKFQLRGRTINFYAWNGYNESYYTGEAPNVKLQLEWVHGYRGKDSRNNLYFLPSNEVMYTTAAVVVIYDFITKSQRHYTEHTDDVKCLALHPNKDIAASGQVAGHAKKEGKPHVRVWRIDSLETLKVVGLGSFQRGLSCIAFSVEDKGVNIVCVDDGNDHCITVWDWENKKKISEAKGGSEPVLAVDFYPKDSKRLVTCGKSHIAFWKLNGDNKLEKRLGVFERHSKPKYVLCFAFGQNSEVITGDSNGNIFIWSSEKNQTTYEIIAAHEGPIFSIETSQDGMFLSGGGRDRKIYLWDCNYNQSEKQLEIPEECGAVRSVIFGPKLSEEICVLIGTTKNCLLQGKLENEKNQFTFLTQGHSEETWGLCVHPTKPVYVTCGYDKMLYMWSAETRCLLWSKQLEDPLQSVCFHPNGNILAVATQNSKFKALDAESGVEFFTCVVGSEQHDCVQFSPDGCYLAIGSHDNFIYVFAVTENGKNYKKYIRFSGHSSYITHFDWSKDSQFIQSNSGDYEMLYWDVNECKQVSSSFSMRDTEWDSWSCVLGLPVRGMWPEGADGTDINSCIRSHDKQYLVSGDDFGCLNIFSYPCPKLKSIPNIARGHSSHVTAVRFLVKDSHLISTGGKDNTVMQWKLES
ncbi:echinoderm microtubule-associated protein-like 2 [Xenia sp. Carnegie-2017]|uniref:echinoderm microtubule-associated protein-like 2 n=1 Tax=Xenia sp. Carnegie-2017 TaxID=2897299 RepID=UPI001F0365E7|nr:echinoderm microtubule-associated protein-like 2 [Xenia sp. Carnegie-2017]XP_046859211.1 echinoderm microtubule-associated protein-like 2 [Xenia sp. Carnegie-2017]